MPYNYLIVFIAYIGGIFPAWCYAYSGLIEIDRWNSEELSRIEATVISMVWPIMLAIVILDHFWRAFRFTIIFLANLMQDKENKQ